MKNKILGLPVGSLIISSFASLFIVAAAIAVFSFVNVKEASAVCVANSFSRDLKEGANGSDVTALQKYLIERNYLKMPQGAAYGYFGGVTKSALIRYQKDQGLTAQGYFGPLTRANISGYLNRTCTSSGFNSQSNSNTTYTYPEYTPPVYPTAAEVARMPVHIAPLTPGINTEFSVAFTSHKSEDPVLLDDAGSNGALQANEKFATKVNGGSGNYRSFWFIDNLDTPQLYDVSISDPVHSRITDRTLNYSFPSSGFWVISTYVVDDFGSKTATTSTVIMTMSKSLADKLEQYENGTLKSSEMSKDLEYKEFVKKISSISYDFEDHPAMSEMYGPANMKAKSAVVKSNLSSLRAQAELFYTTHNNSYAGVCSDSATQKLFKSAEIGIQGSINCIEAPNYWRAFATLKENGKFVCVDSSGHSIETERISGYKCQ